MNITAKELEERYKVIEIKKISDDVEIVDLWKAKDDISYHIRLMFAFNKLFTSGDVGSFTFGECICHIYTFFKGDNVNLGYWKQKVEASPRPLRCIDVDVEKLLKLLEEFLNEYEIEYSEDKIDKIGEQNILENLNVSNAWEVAGDMIDECRDWDGQFEYTCNVIQWVENNLDEWRKLYAC